ncbi:MAG TPA: hypothetical protein VG456_27850 [Candidatus Sulfopaludibacter sp.]|nr:hypothetical protein [Candidatus Sulfopaludibacter sp.]
MSPRLLAALLIAISADAATLQSLPPLTGAAAQAVTADWLITPLIRAARAYRSESGKELILTNGLIRRNWRISPDAATVSFTNLRTRESLLRGVKPEAVVEINGVEWNVGGLDGQPDYAYLNPAWLDRMTAHAHAFHFTGFDLDQPRAPFAWKPVKPAPSAPWPPPGIALTLHFAQPALPGIEVLVHYEMYDALPLMAKWITVRNSSPAEINLNRLTTELLAVVDSESTVDHPPLPPNVLHVETDYAFNGMDSRSASRTVNWLPDPDYKSQVNYALESPVLLQVRPPVGPAAAIPASGSWTSFRTFELAYDSTDRERRGLTQRRMYRTIAPWAAENPIFMHVRRADPESVKLAIDQCAATGFEMVIISFGSGLNMESEDPAYLAQMKSLADYAHSKGIRLGGYSLLASRHIDEANDVINPKTGKSGGAIFGNSPCLGSAWGIEYFRKLQHFLTVTGFDVLEHDGSYPGDVCASTRHPGHRGLEDSQMRQWHQITEFYRWCRTRGIYLNVPDWYFLNGSNKTAMGYRETNWSLPRDRQIILGRQNIYDGTWTKTPSMGWMFVPLVEYHGGGAAATLEPLEQHLADYEQHLAQNFSSGVQAAYRGPRLYDSPKTEAVVSKWVAFYKAHRAILESDLIHLRRPDGADIDTVLHVNPQLPERALAVVFNPTDLPVTRTLTLPLYYAGLTQNAQIRVQDAAAKTYTLDRDYSVPVPLQIPAHGLTWLVVLP